MKFQQKLEAIALRKSGLSYKKINKKISVSRGTLSLWLRDIELTDEQKRILMIDKRMGGYKGAKTQQKNRLNRTALRMKEAQNEFRKFFKDPLFLAGLLLYWAEGDKHKKEMVKFTNSDPDMIALMMRWFREICRVKEEKFRILIHLHNFHINDEIEKYWSGITGIPLNQFHKSYIKKSSLASRRNVLYNGTCAVRVNDVDLFRRIMGWKKALTHKFVLSPRSSMDRTKDF